jgi:hypothetical protein
MSHVSLSEISTRRFPLHANDQSRLQLSAKKTSYNSCAKTTRTSLSKMSFLRTQAIPEKMTRSNNRYSRAHDLRREFLPHVVVHKWYLQHVKIPVHVVLPVCFKKFCNIFKKKQVAWEILTEDVPGTANANSSKSELTR